jgi:hypothetical protein
MKLHSDSVIDKLEDKEKETLALEKKLSALKKEIKEVEEYWKLEAKASEQESHALKRALENKIDIVLGLEKEMRDLVT